MTGRIPNTMKYVNADTFTIQIKHLQYICILYIYAIIYIYIYIYIYFLYIAISKY